MNRHCCFDILVVCPHPPCFPSVRHAYVRPMMSDPSHHQNANNGAKKQKCYVCVEYWCGLVTAQPNVIESEKKVLFD